MDVIITAEQGNLSLTVCLESWTTVIAALQRGLDAGCVYAWLLYRYWTAAIRVCRSLHFVVIGLTSDVIGSDLRVEHALQSWVIISHEDFACNEPLRIHSHPCLWIYNITLSLRVSVLTVLSTTNPIDFKFYDLRLAIALRSRDRSNIWIVVLLIR